MADGLFMRVYAPTFPSPSRFVDFVGLCNQKCYAIYYWVCARWKGWVMHVSCENAIHWINHYPADSVVCFVNTYPLDSVIHLSNNWGLTFCFNVNW